MLLPDRWFDLALGVGLVIVASIYGAFLSVGSGLGIFNRVRKGLMQAILILGIGYWTISAFDLRPFINSQFMSGSSINQIEKLNWQMYSEAALQKAAQEGKPVIIDFWAEWCAACHELEEHTFTDPRVRAMAENFVLLKFDATSENAELKALKKKYNIQGLPTVIFINPHGVWIDALTLTQFEKPDAFLKRMEKGSN
ncbi:Thiol:disulfide interchange protein DsbD precursor [compost metagenome]